MARVSRYVVRHFDVRHGSVVRRYRTFLAARLRFAWLRYLGFSASMTDTRNLWRIFT